MVPRLLDTLEFRSNNDRYQPLITALALLKKYVGSHLRAYPLDEQVPLDGVVRSQWRDAVLEVDKEGRERVNRITYELCVLQTLRDQLRCKELWVVGANRYRNLHVGLAAIINPRGRYAYSGYEMQSVVDGLRARVAARLVEVLVALSVTESGDLQRIHQLLTTQAQSVVDDVLAGWQRAQDYDVRVVVVSLYFTDGSVGRLAAQPRWP